MIALTHTVLIYHTTRSQEYAQLVRELLPGVRLLVSSTPKDAARHIAEAEILFAWRFPTHLLGQAPRLQWLQAMGAGVDDLVGAPLPPGVVLTRVEGLFASYMSEYAFAHMLAHAQQLPRIYANQARRQWEPFLIGKLAGKRLGVAGAGSIGIEVARKGKAFGMEVWALVRTRRPLDGVDRLFLPDRAREFTAGVDYLVSTLPHTPETEGLIDPLQMKPGSLLINMGRGATLDEQALLEAARQGRIQAVLDVFRTEPLPQDHPLWTAPGITVTPHLAGPSVPEEVARYFAENFRRYQTGQPLMGLVDRQRGY